MDGIILKELYNEVNMLNASIDIYNDFLKKQVSSEDEKENLEIKLNLVKEEALKHNLKIRRLIDSMGY